MKRSGILLHISSLSSNGGIGTLGKEAFAFVDFLRDSGMSIWQVLPIGPVGLGGSPYQSPSAFAGNPLLIDFETLQHEGILKAEDWQSLKQIKSSRVDFDFLHQSRLKILKAAYLRADAAVKDKVDAFAAKNTWLGDYSLYCALTDHFQKPWTQWSDDAVRFREPQAMRRYAQQLEPDIGFHRFVQMLFFRQWSALKRYANQNGIDIFGDMPIYTAMESVDTWAHPDLFQLDGRGYPKAVAGVPPDYFSRDGQLWGNPLYNWKRLKAMDYAWWTERMLKTAERFDIVRIDHFIGLVKYYAIRAGAPTARHGRWRNGPGRSLLRTLESNVPGLEIVAEDLGVVKPKVNRLLKEFGYPGMKVLEFAFNSDEKNRHLPQNITSDTVMYTGTHDNDTVAGWWRQAGQAERRFAAAYLGIEDDADICKAMIEAAFASPADTVIIPMQDFLGLGSEARMNMPGTVGGNWEWRMQPGQLTDHMQLSILALNQKYGRMRDLAT